jgi:leucyl aminopeptidase
MNYSPSTSSETTKHVGLVGKGITFDTGGLNIKTAGMVHMKCDMAGVQQFWSDAINCGLKIAYVTAIVPCTGNSVSSKSFTSDVIEL